MKHVVVIAILLIILSGCVLRSSENVTESNNELPVQDEVFAVSVDNVTSTSVILSFVDTNLMTQHNYRLWLGSQKRYSYWSNFARSSGGRYFSEPTYLKPQQKYYFEIREGKESRFKGSFTTESEAHDIAIETSSVFPCKACENDIVKARQLIYSAMKSRHYPSSGLIGEERTKMYDSIALLESCISAVTSSDCTQEVKDITISAMMNDIGFCHTFLRNEYLASDYFYKAISYNKDNTYAQKNIEATMDLQRSVGGMYYLSK